jgi:hypothetical protein
MSRASGSDRASRPSFVTTSVSPAAGGQREPETGAVPVGAGKAVVDVDAIIADTERGKLVRDDLTCPR